MQQEIQLLQNEISREIRLKDKLDKELRQLQLDMEARMGEIKGLNVQAVKAREEQQKLEHQIRELKVRETIREIKKNNVGHTQKQHNCLCISLE